MRRKPKRTGRAALFLLLRVFVVFAVLETACRLAYRLGHGHSVQSEMSVIPHDALVFQKNPLLHGDPFLVPPESLGADKVRVWILGGSTSATEPNGNDWPTEFAKLFASGARIPSFIINMACNGYGSSQLRWLYSRYRDAVQPSIVVVFDGWNGRGAITAPYAHVPANTCSRFSGPLRCGSAWLIRHSTLYALLADAVLKRGSRENEPGSEDTPQARESLKAEIAAWELELRDMVAEMRRDNVFLVVYPGLAMRDDARAEAGARAPVIARDWERARFDYNLRIEALLRVASATNVPVLDAREAYRRLPPGQFASFFKDSMHQTAEGNRFLADILARELRRREPRRGWQAP